MFINDFKSIVLNSTPLIDVRSPIEFAKGSFPNATNLPLINDEERHSIGICYKKYGSKKAIELGHKLVSGTSKQKRIDAWIDFIKANEDAKLFCFRGGQRSKIAQEWIYEFGYNISRFKGGYKVFRNYLIRELEDSCSKFTPIILGGRTGSGKTILLKTLENSIDLEGLANHKGSSFGRQVTPQPTQINFENEMAYELIKKLDKGFKSLVFEDEGNRVGSVFIPKVFADYLLDAPVIILEVPTAQRVKITFDEYVVQAQKDYKYNADEWKNEILNSINRIKKRLGSERHKDVLDTFENAYKEQMRSGSLESHKEWIETLLVEYYDPMYDYQIEKKIQQVKFKGSSQEIKEYLNAK